MKTRLLKKLRKEAKRYIRLYPRGFEESYDQCFSHDSTPVEIRIAHVNDSIKKYITIDGVELVYMVLNIGGSLMWGWSGIFRLNKAKKILKTLRREYILQECERIRKDRLFKNNKNEYEDFKKYIESL